MVARYSDHLAYFFLVNIIFKVDKDYRRYEKKIQDMQAKEGEMAATFVEKVSYISKRAEERGGEW